MNVQAILANATAALQRNDHPAASRLFASLLSSTDRKADGYFGLGVIRLREGLYDAASDMFATALALGAPADHAQYLLGQVEERRGRSDKAIDLYRRALAANPAHLQARQRLQRLAPSQPAASPGVDARPAAREAAAAAAMPAHATFVERLRADPNPASQQAATAIARLEGELRPQLRFALDAVVSRAVGTFLKVLPVLLFLFFGMVILTVDTSRAVGSPIELFSRAGPGFKLACVLAVLLAGFAAIAGAIDVARRRYRFRDGRLMFRQGAFRSTDVNVELFRIREIGIAEGPIAGLMGGASLEVSVGDARGDALKLIGLGRTQAEQASELIREAVVNLRTIPWIKGVIPV